MLSRIKGGCGVSWKLTILKLNHMSVNYGCHHLSYRNVFLVNNNILDMIDNSYHEINTDF